MFRRMPAAGASVAATTVVGLVMLASACGSDEALDSARACITANESIKQKARLTI
jgi:hypothetical protein